MTPPLSAIDQQIISQLSAVLDKQEALSFRMNEMSTKIEVVIAKNDAAVAVRTANVESIKHINEVLFGTNAKDVGVVGEITIIKKWIEDRVWFERLIIAAVVSEAFGVLMILLKMYLIK